MCSSILVFKQKKLTEKQRSKAGTEAVEETTRKQETNRENKTKIRYIEEVREIAKQLVSDREIKAKNRKI